jgi:hypothetical protein
LHTIWREARKILQPQKQGLALIDSNFQQPEPRHVPKAGQRGLIKVVIPMHHRAMAASSHHELGQGLTQPFACTPGRLTELLFHANVGRQHRKKQQQLWHCQAHFRF